MQSAPSIWLTSPTRSLCAGYLYIAVFVFALRGYGLFGQGFFSWGAPCVLMGKTIVDDDEFYMILFIYFGHQLMNNWVNNTTYRFIINTIQDQKTRRVGMPRIQALVLVNLFDIYSSLDTLLIISGVMSQASFFLAIVMANLIASTLINNQYLLDKHD